MSSNCTSTTAVAVAPLSASKTKTKKKHFVCQKVKLFRASEPILSVLMWGVNHTINELSNVPVPVMLMPDDFKAYSKIKVDNHLFNKENLPSRFKFKEYCPMVFRNLRERFGIDDQDYQNSVTRSAPINSDSQGRCGTRFLTTYDRRFVIKTVSSEDVAEMHNILKKYHQFIVECHGNTLLPQFLGMYRLTVDGVETYMVVTRNVFSHRLTVHRKYDLKGSTVAREASDKEKAKDLPTFKDNDFLNEGQKLHVGEESKKNFLEKLKRDVENSFLVVPIVEGATGHQSNRKPAREIHQPCLFLALILHLPRHLIRVGLLWRSSEDMCYIVTAMSGHMITRSPSS
ncbi:phosphatidylinositol 5-phosphate 4-kinase type-2 beta isoform X3 [Eptesicus fuscus]|uniref:phosphatidylinositol 5-phosphate 4-kinase type-2 beta isoform X3 n=1 Tax=Eptesicus fuscus TaxID=29078 RepID=UPI00240450DF|nr:phosphatidylinositol 5-phosphate 4-kinase type-2 beta isoform X3 [Eptesicus fuscus]